MLDLERLRYLASPDAERLSDFQRLNEFVKLGHEAADEIERLHEIIRVVTLAATVSSLTALGYENALAQVRAAITATSGPND